MKLQDQVCTLEQAKKLKQLGLSSQSIAQWRDFDDLKDSRVKPEVKTEILRPSDSSVMQVYPAYTVAELGEPLHAFGDYWSIMQNLKSKQYIFRLSFGLNVYQGSRKTEAEARAAVLIYLLENNLINA